MSTLIIFFPDIHNSQDELAGIRTQHLKLCFPDESVLPTEPSLNLSASVAAQN